MAAQSKAEDVQRFARIHPSAAGGMLAAMLGIAALLVLFLPTLALPLERDEGEYAHAADILAAGGVLYRDTFLQKMPGTPLVYRAAIAMLGRSPQSIHLFGLAGYLVTAGLLGWMASRLSAKERSSIAAGLATAIFSLALISPIFQSTASNTEAFFVPCIAGAVACLIVLHRRNVPRLSGSHLVAGAGFLLGLAMSFNQLAALYAPYIAVTVWMLAPTAGIRVRWVGLLTIVASVPLLLNVAWFTALGALPSFLDAVVLHNVEYAGGGLEPHGRVRLVVRAVQLGAFNWLLWSGACLAVAALILRCRWWLAWLLGGWLVTGLFATTIGGHYRGHYFQQVLPAVSLLTALAAASFTPRKLAVVAGIAIGMWDLAAPWPFGKSAVRMHEDRYRTRRFVNAPSVAAVLDSLPPGPIFILGSEPELLFYSERRSVTRYVIADPLFGGYTSATARQREVWDAVVATRPAVIVTSIGVSIPLFPGSDSTLYRLVHGLIARDYELVAYTRQDTTGTFDPVITPVADTTDIDMSVYFRITDAVLRTARQPLSSEAKAGGSSRR